MRHFIKESDKYYFKSPKLVVGYLVYIKSTNLSLKLLSKKLGPKFCGLFPIIEKINLIAFYVLFPISYKIHNVFHVSKFKMFQPLLSGQTTYPKQEYHTTLRRIIKLKIYLTITLERTAYNTL